MGWTVARRPCLSGECLLPQVGTPRSPLALPLALPHLQARCFASLLPYPLQGHLSYFITYPDFLISWGSLLLLVITAVGGLLLQNAALMHFDASEVHLRLKHPVAACGVQYVVCSVVLSMQSYVVCSMWHAVCVMQFVVSSLWHVVCCLHAHTVGCLVICPVVYSFAADGRPSDFFSLCVLLFALCSLLYAFRSMLFAIFLSLFALYYLLLPLLCASLIAFPCDQIPIFLYCRSYLCTSQCLCYPASLPPHLLLTRFSTRWSCCSCLA